MRVPRYTKTAVVPHDSPTVLTLRRPAEPLPVRFSARRAIVLPRQRWLICVGAHLLVPKPRCTPCWRQPSPPVVLAVCRPAAVSRRPAVLTIRDTDPCGRVIFSRESSNQHLNVLRPADNVRYEGIDCLCGNISSKEGSRSARKRLTPIRLASSCERCLERLRDIFGRLLELRTLGDIFDRSMRDGQELASQYQPARQGETTYI